MWLWLGPPMTRNQHVVYFWQQNVCPSARKWRCHYSNTLTVTHQGQHRERTCEAWRLCCELIDCLQSSDCLSHHRLSFFRLQDWLHGLYDWTVFSFIPLLFLFIGSVRQIKLAISLRQLLGARKYNNRIVSHRSESNKVITLQCSYISWKTVQYV